MSEQYVMMIEGHAVPCHKLDPRAIGYIVSKSDHDAIRSHGTVVSNIPPPIRPKPSDCSKIIFTPHIQESGEISQVDFKNILKQANEDNL